MRSITPLVRRGGTVVLIVLLTLPAVQSAPLSFDWASASDFKTAAIPTYLNQVNPSMDRESPIHDAVFERMGSLGAKLVRYLHWSHSQAPFPELEEGVFNFTLADQYVSDFMACKNAEDSVINFDAAPAWLHVDKDLGKPLRDPTGRELGEWISRIVSWYTKGGFTDTRTGKKYTSSFQYKWRNYEVLNEPNLKGYMGTFPRTPTNTSNVTVCAGGPTKCAMVQEPKNSFYGGTYTGHPPIASSTDCNAACLSDPTCVQTTWAPTHAKRPDGACCLYRSIDKDDQKNTTTSDPDVTSWTKCPIGATVAADCAAFSPGGGGGGKLAPYEAYTKLYDGIAGVLARDHPELQLHALSLAQDNRLAVDSSPGALAAVYDDNWFSHFFDASNHAPGAPLPTYVTYHFYAFPGHDTDDKAGAIWGPEARWPVDKKSKRPATLPVSAWPVHLFKQAARFVARAEHVNGLVHAGTFGADVKISANEVGVIGGSLCPSKDLFSTADGRLYWNLKASLWAYYFGELARLGVDAIASSQITGYPPSTWNIHGKPVANNFPCVSMLDWHDGSHTAVSWALQMFIDVLGAGVGGSANDQMAVVPPDVTVGPAEKAVAADDAPYWPLPSVLYSVGFTMQSGKKIVLLANTNSTNTSTTLTGSVGGKLHLVDTTAGHGAVPYATTELKSEVVALGPLAVALIELPAEPAATVAAGHF